MPARDRGIDLIAYLDLSANTKKFMARPIQMKAASKKSFSLYRKYARIADLIIVYIWFVENPEKTEMYALIYSEALSVATKMGWTKTHSWKMGGYSTNSPSEKLRALLKPYRMHGGDWKKKILSK